MTYIKAKYLKNDIPTGRAYTYRSEENLSVGDKVETADGKHLIVVDETVDMAWVETYGADKIGVVKKVCGPIEEYRIVEIRSSKDGLIRTDGRYPLRIGRVVKKPNPRISVPMILEYLRNADGSDYSNRILHTSNVVGDSYCCGVWEIETLNSIYVFEPIKAESEE